MTVEEKEMDIKYLKEECFALICRCGKAEDALKEAKKSEQCWFNESMAAKARLNKVEAELTIVKARLAELETKDDIDLCEGDTECTTS